MVKQNLHFSLTYFLILFHLSCFTCLDVSRIQRSRSNKFDINHFIYGLQYNKDDVLFYREEAEQGVKTKGIIDDNNNFNVITHERKSVYNAESNFGILSRNEHKTYPGSLLLANYHLIDNVPDFLSVQRAPLRYTVNLPGFTSDGHFEIIPTFANYQSAMNNALNTWFKKYANIYHVNPILQSDYSFAHSEQQLRVKFGMTFKNSDVELNTDFSAVDEQQKLIMIQRFQLIYYTVSVGSSPTPAALFGNDVTLHQLGSKINNQNPPVIVDSVTYGRVIYVKIETTSTDQEAKNIIETKLTNLNAGSDSEFDYSQQLKNFNMQIYVMGGGTEDVDLINVKTMKDVNDVINKYSKFTRDNMGFPIFYTAQFIKDNTKAIIRSMVEYTETTRTEYEKGVIRLEQYGGYIAQWVIEWDETNYDENGNKITKRVGWGNNWKDAVSPFTTDIVLAGNCDNISVFAREVTGLAWEWWRTVINFKGIQLINHRVFKISGTTLNPTFTIDPPL